MENVVETMEKQSSPVPDDAAAENGKISFSILGKEAFAALKGRWGQSIFTCLIPTLLCIAINSIPFACLLSGILVFPLTVGVMLYFLKLIRKENVQPELTFEPYRQFWRMIWGYFRVAIFVFLHFLLLIFPAYVAMMRYSMTYYIMLDNPTMSVRDSMILSREMMYGHKLQLFGYALLLGLIGLLIGIFTLCIGFLWFAPFVQVFYVSYYEKLKKEYELKNPEVTAKNENAADNTENIEAAADTGEC